MKKLMFCAIALMLSINAFADSSLTSGSLAALKRSNVRIFVIWDYEQMTIEDKDPDTFLREKGADWVRDYPAEVSAGESAFDVDFNKKDKKYALITDDEEDAQFAFVIHVNKFHYGSTGAAIMFGGFARGAHMEGKVDVVDLSSEEMIAQISFNCSGKAAYTNEQRRILAYMDLAKDLAKLIAKSK